MAAFKIKSSFFFGMVLSLTVLCVCRPAFAEKYTVCAATINSPDERNVYMSRLPKKDFRFVELTDFKKPENLPDSPNDFEDYDEDWFTEACRQARIGKLKCDVLVVSGHFAGTSF